MRSIFLGLVFSIACVPAGAYETTTRSISLDKYGSLEIQAPVSWKDSVESRPANGLPASIKLTPKAGARFEIYVTPFPPEVANGRPASMDELRRSAREAANSIASKAVEKPIELREMRNAGTSGYYFAVTDKAPKADEYKYLSQGVLAVGQLRVMFTILTNDGQESIVKEALAMVSAAVHR